jgi:hypothetical protein
MPDHQPLWNVSILGIPVLILGTGLSLLTLIPCSLAARNFRVLSRATEQVTTPQSLESLMCMDRSFSVDLESTKVTSEKVLGLVPTAAHAILRYDPCATELKTTLRPSCQLQSRLAHHRGLPERSDTANFTHDCPRSGIICRHTAPASQSTTLGESLPSKSTIPDITFDQTHSKRTLALPVTFLALSALAFLFSLLAHFWANKE